MLGDMGKKEKTQSCWTGSTHPPGSQQEKGMNLRLNEESGNCRPRKRQLERKLCPRPGSEGQTSLARMKKKWDKGPVL